MALIAWPLSGAAQDIETRRITFPPGASSATVSGSITGRQAVDYKVRGEAGQTMSVALRTSHASNYFNVLPPGSETALANSSITGNQWTGTLPADGDYTIRVYLMRSAARRDESADYTLTVGITGDASSANAGGVEARVPGAPCHATGTAPCSVDADRKGAAEHYFTSSAAGRNGPASLPLHPAATPRRTGARRHTTG